MESNIVPFLGPLAQWLNLSKPVRYIFRDIEMMPDVEGNATDVSMREPLCDGKDLKKEVDKSKVCSQYNPKCHNLNCRVTWTSLHQWRLSRRFWPV